MTVDELIAVLSELPPEERELGVDIEGCDCIGSACGVRITGPNGTRPRGKVRRVLIEREA